MNRRTIEQKLNTLPEKLQKEALDFIESLISKSQKENKGDKGEAFNFSWEGGLTDYKDKYTSVELQHASTEWR